ncbi:hypothetical protein ACLIBG_09600 [Virgibacillus sp. W0181]|uniref:hypothetical protein n=1 Tax=Virgibacillus sp. W0181 TaxID=3391581 RepID=UPI003F449ED4
MKIKLIAPFKTSLNILYFNAMRDHKSYVEFWNNVKEQYNDNASINFLHSKEREFIYELINEDGNYLSPELFTISNDPVVQEILELAQDRFMEPCNKYGITFDHQLKETTCHIFDNTIGIMETTIYIHRQIEMFDELELRAFINDIQLFSNEFMKYVSQSYYDKSLQQLFNKIKSLDKDHYVQKDLTDEQILNKSDKKVKRGFFKAEHVGIPLWVNRTLYVPTFENETFLYHHWLSLGNEGIDQVDKQVRRDGFYFGWGNNLVINGYEEKLLSCAVEALNLCQYYNVVLDHMNNQLSKLIGEVYSIKGRGKAVKRMEKLLEVNIENVNLIFMQLKEQVLNLQGYRKKYFEEILFKWKIDAIKDSITNKINFSKDRLDYFYRKYTKFSSTVSESILFAIGGIALVDFFANVSQFSRTIRANPEMAILDNESIGFIRLGNALSPDNMIWTGILILLFVMFVFVYVKRRG